MKHASKVIYALFWVVITPVIALFGWWWLFDNSTYIDFYNVRTEREVAGEFVAEGVFSPGDTFYVAFDGFKHRRCDVEWKRTITNTHIYSIPQENVNLVNDPGKFSARVAVHLPEYFSAGEYTYSARGYATHCETFGFRNPIGEMWVKGVTVKFIVSAPPLQRKERFK